MGVDLSLIRGHRDTQQEAYQLCSLPQGLKALVYRLFGATMTSWEDLVWTASVDAWVSWCEDAMMLAATKPDVEVTELKRGKCVACGHQHSKGPCKHDGCTETKVTYQKVEYKPSAMESILRHLHRYTVQTRDDEEPYNPWKEFPQKKVEGLRGRTVSVDEWAWMLDEVGCAPELGIGNCELKEAVRYGCADADWTGRVATELAKLRTDKKWKIDEADHDV